MDETTLCQLVNTFSINSVHFSNAPVPACNTPIHFDCLNIMYTNLDSLLNKRSELLIAIHDHNPDINIVEAPPKNINTHIEMSELSLSNYTLFTNFTTK